MRILACLTVLSFAVPVAHATDAVTVTFVDAAHYRDAAFNREGDADPAVLTGIEKHLQSLGHRYLPAEQKLSVQVLDIDLAGRLEPWHAANPDIRYLRDITWPRIKLRYTLEQEGRVLGEADETIADMNYLFRGSSYFSTDRLRYEKQMLDDWFRARFAEHRAQR
ncbi:MAG TPA: DUF3016 domain-containing protein [Burkholderiales bacterium]|nr:DUF3016 domain-containing protein [Burkholderiales bacterium]